MLVESCCCVCQLELHDAAQWVKEEGKKGNIREITGCFLVLDLLFREESREGDDVGVDFFARVCHLGGWW